MHARLNVCGPLATAMVLTAGTADAEPPAEADFEIRYFLTDGSGDKSRQLTFQDMQQLVNRARCECGQEIVAQIQLTNTSGSVDDVQVQTFVGNSCDSAQNMNNGELRCARLGVGFPNTFQTRQSFGVHPLWLRTGVVGSQEIDVAVAGESCASGQGAAGIYMCALGEDTDCRFEDFFMTGTANENVPEDETPQGITFDFSPPVSVPSNVEISPGDKAVVLKWSLDTPGDINGYRVLCANMDGTPVEGKNGATAPSPTAENNGTIYYTAATLCPDGPFSDMPEIFGAGGGSTGGGSTGGGSTGGGSGTAGGRSGTAGGSSGSSGTAGSSTAGSSTGTAGTGTAGTTDGTGSTTGGGSPSPLMDLGYEYVCSGHLPATTNKIRIGGLQNNETYQFLLVAYDVAGNPQATSTDPLPGTPEATNDLWDTCQNDKFSGVCGERGFCRCRVDADPTRDLTLSFLGLGLLGLLRPRRRR